MTRMEVMFGTGISALALVGTLCGTPMRQEPAALGDPIWQAERGRTEPTVTAIPNPHVSRRSPVVPVATASPLASSSLSQSQKEKIEQKLEQIEKIEDPVERTQRKANILRKLPANVMDDALRDTIQDRADESQDRLDVKRDAQALTPTPEASE